eukprot:TRINITY_DN14346_c0_g1_i2.p1 TRINITY_DN14346_c0_g1~~TRINITY_DN14346_c0_g1_i2.p1  ORF type:complete len:173 (+),score=44.09 TRINITY_DN14346_c0_g1_i2:81-599(+)
MAAELQELVATCKVHEIKELLKEFGKQDLDAKLLVECNEFGGRGSRSSLHNAAVRGRAEILALLLSTKANPNITDDAGTSPLHFAADLGHARVAFHLLQAGADPTLKNAFSSTPMDKLAINSWDASDTSEGKRQIQRLIEGEDIPFETLREEPEPPLPASPTSPGGHRRGGA